MNEKKLSIIKKVLNVNDWDVKESYSDALFRMMRVEKHFNLKNQK